MKVTINHVQKKTGLIRRVTHHGVSVLVEFNAEEKAVIRERRLQNDVIMDRGYPSDMSAREIEKRESRSVGRKLLTAAISGSDALHFDLTVKKLLQGEDVYFFQRPVEAKEYEAVVRERLLELKDWIMGNAELETETLSFEIF